MLEVIAEVGSTSLQFAYVTRSRPGADWNGILFTTFFTSYLVNSPSITSLSVVLGHDPNGGAPELSKSGVGLPSSTNWSWTNNFVQ